MPAISAIATAAWTWAANVITGPLGALCLLVAVTLAGVAVVSLLRWWRR